MRPSKLAIVFVTLWPNFASADQYPVSDVWVSTTSNISESCASYRKNPKSPEGNVLVFSGSKKTEFNGGYLEEETVDNLSVKQIAPSQFQIVDRYFSDGEGGGRTGYKRRSYKLTLLSADKIEIKEGQYPGSQYIRCTASQKLATSSPANAPPKTARSRQESFYPQAALVQSDDTFVAVDPWKISPNRFGIGCVATYNYYDGRYLRVGGESPNKLAIVVEADRKLFDTNLDAEPYIDGVELGLDNFRKGKLMPYGYRGTPGFVAIFDLAMSSAFISASSLRLLEKEKIALVISLTNTKNMMDTLADCFRKSVPPVGATKSADEAKQTSGFSPRNIAEYNKQLVEHLGKFKKYPAIAREERRSGSAVIKFTVDRGGSVLTSAITASSGFADLDQEAVAMLTRAQPLPALPVEVTEQTRTFSLPVRFNWQEAAKEKPEVAQLEYRIMQSSDGQVIGVTGLGNGEGCQRESVLGQIVSRSFNDDALTLNGLVIERRNGLRSHVNVDIPEQLGGNFKDMLFSTLQTKTRIGNSVTIVVFQCGAAGRALYLNEIR